MNVFIIILCFSVLPLVFGVCVDQLPYLLVMQFYGVEGSCITLSNALKTQLLKSATTWLPVTYSIADGLQYIHEKGYLHNDLKGDNIVITKRDEQYNPVIIDFGKDEAKLYSLSNSKQVEYKKYHKHIAPEVVAGTHHQSFASDIYAFGRIIASIHKYFENSLNVLQEIYLTCLECDPQKRPNIATLLDSLRSLT